MRAMTKVTVALVLLLVGSAPIVAEETLVVVDSSGAILGPVISGASGDSNNWTFVYKQAPTWTTLRTNGPNRVESALTPLHQTLIYYVGSGCTGSPVLAILQQCCGQDLAPITVVAGSQIYEIDTSATVDITVASYRDTYLAPGGCTDFGPALVNGRALSLWGTIAFTPPLSVTLNPLLFNDGFGTGDPTRWSNY